MDVPVILFVDFDGVMHATGGATAPLEYADLLAEMLEPYPGVEIVLSSSWVETFGFDDTRAMLPESLQRRVVGTTYNRAGQPGDSRYAEIARYVEQHSITKWLALDDDDRDWPADLRPALVLVPGELGIGSPATQAELDDKLRQLSH